MRKFLLFLGILLFSSQINAQTAIEKSKLFDNVYVGIYGGAFTPLNLNSVFPLNYTAGVKVGKNITPIVGFNIESNVWFNNNVTFVNAVNVGLNNNIHLSRIFYKYPRIDVSTVAGLGYLHRYNDGGYLYGKTGLNFSLNLGKAFALQLEPSIYWNLNKNNKIQFNKNNAQLGLQVGIVYKFKNSNGKRDFVYYDINEYNTKINLLQEELDKKPKVIEVEKVIEKEKVYQPEYYIFFAKNDATLGMEAIEILNKISTDEVEILGFASPEGDSDHNIKLSQERADNVAEFLKKKNIKIKSSVGLGVQGNSSNRVAIVHIVK